ncbi:Pyridoxine 4-dehydrogenase [Chlorociboria aeruginascens]|nr:Pyridoxine 4-dehydrogenase [Chlorociboria aeruginascens]
MSVSLAGKKVGPIGFGLMGLTWRANPTPYDQATEVLKAALDRGANFWNAAQFYGPPNANSLQLLNHYFTAYPEDSKKIVLSMKGAFGAHGPDCTPAGIQSSIENCLEVLDGKVFIDIFAPARVDPEVPIEDTIKTLAEYVTAGKIGGIGLSEVNATTIRRAHAVHPIASVEVEMSLFSTDPLTDGIAKACAELNIPLVAYSPLSRGFLSGQIHGLDDIPENDSRRRFPRFQPDVFDLNLKLVSEVEKLAKKKNVTVPQIAIGWVLAQGKAAGAPVVIPIPGSTTVSRVHENLTQVTLTSDDLEEIAQILSKFEVHGDRYGGPFRKFQSL